MEQKKILWFLFFFVAAAFLAGLHWTPYTGSWLVKSFPVLCLAVFARTAVPGSKGTLLCLGFLFSAAGDVLLELPGKGFFIPGMGAFILAHLCYLGVFFRRPKATPARALVIFVMLAYSLWIGRHLLPHLGGMVVPIFVYLGVIGLMGISACLGRDNNWQVMAGACLFIVSDSLIACNKFVSPIPLSSLWVMSTYYGAQALIAAGVAAAAPAGKQVRRG